MPRAKKRCAKPDCPNYSPCKTHRTWVRSKNYVPLPSNWRSLRKRARGFREKKCYLCSKIDPTGQVDHIINRARGGAEDPSNYAWICTACHKIKTDREKRG